MEVQDKMSTKFGSLYLTASENGLTGIYWRKRRVPMGRSKWLIQAKKELGEYFEGRRRKFDVALDLRGTAFQLKVWRELARIPYGKTLSYTDLALKIGREGAVRAVGSANARNPLSIIVPCHRVVSRSGGMTGYSAGVKVKARLLLLESLK